MNKKAIKYMIISLIMINCMYIISQTAMAHTISFSSNNLEDLTSYVHNEKNEADKRDKHKGFNVFSEDNNKYLSSDQKKSLIELKKCKDKGDNLSKEQIETLHSIMDCIIKGKLGDEKYENFKSLIEKKKSNVTLTKEEDEKLKEYKNIIEGSKPSTKDILNQFLR